MIYKSNSHISKLDSARKITAGMVFKAMLVCGLFCILGGVLWFNTSALRVRAEGLYSPLKVEISFECMKNIKLSNGSYTIGIYPTDESCPLPEQEKININDGVGSFFITFTEPGNYTYLVYQEKGDDDDVIYDETVYEVHINVMDEKWDSEESGSSEDGLIELVAYMSVNYAGTDKKPQLIEFENEPSDGGGTGVTDDTTENTTEETSENTSGDDTEGTTEESGTDGSSEGSSDGVKTGDSTDIGFLMSVMGISAAAVFILIFLKISSDKKRAEEEE